MQFYITLAVLLLAAGEVEAQSVRVVVLSGTPAVRGWRYLYYINEALPELKQRYSDATFEILAPEYTPTPLDSTDSKYAFERVTNVSESMWTTEKATEQAKAVLGNATQELLIVVGGIDVKSLCDQLTGQFPALLILGFDDVSKEQKQYSWSCGVVALPAPTRAAYTNGLVAGVAAANSGRNILAIVFKDDTVAQTSLSAFVQGVADTGVDICLQVAQVSQGSRRNYTMDALAWDATEGRVRDAMEGGNTTDVVYSQLGIFDAAVAAAVSRKNKQSNYNPLSVVGIGGGAVVEENLGMVLSRDLLNWSTLIGSAVEAAMHGKLPNLVPADTSFSMWSDPDLIANLEKPANRVAERNCSAKDGTKQTRGDTIAGIPSTTSTFSPFTDFRKQCLYLPQVTNGAKTTELISACVPGGGNVRVIGVGMYINNLGDVDMQAGSVYVDMNLYLHEYRYKVGTLQDAADLSPGGQCKSGDFRENEWVGYLPPAKAGDLDKSLMFLSMDRVKTITPVLDPQRNEISYYRVQGLHYFSPELDDWPLDRQRLRLVLEEAAQMAMYNTTAVFCHMPHFSGMSPRARYFPGMTLTEGSSLWTYATSFSCWPYLRYPTAYVQGTCPAEEPPLDIPEGAARGPSCSCLGGVQVSSRYTWTLDFVRPVLAVFLKSVLPPIFITAVNQGAWFLHPKSYETRLGICGSGLLSAVMYHANIAAQTPPTSVVTWADRFMLVVYFNNISVFLFVFTQSVLWQGHFTVLAMHLFRFSRITGVICAILSFLGPVIFSTATGVVLWALFTTIVIFILTKLIQLRGTGCQHALARLLVSIEERLPHEMPPPPTDDSFASSRKLASVHGGAEEQPVEKPRQLTLDEEAEPVTESWSRVPGAGADESGAGSRAAD
eukprot:Hpha_TRINITY_DN16056_c1_g3::TRINITY_DN16056_c1_g3_i1::g.121242::m.121242